jgi:hypothetical protein
MEVDIYTTNKKLNDLLGNELNRQKRIFQSVKFYAYMNDRIIHGIEAYYDRRGLYDIESKLLKKDELMNNFDFEFLQTIIRKY